MIDVNKSPPECEDAECFWYEGVSGNGAGKGLRRKLCDRHNDDSLFIVHYITCSTGLNMYLMMKCKSDNCLKVCYSM